MKLEIKHVKGYLGTECNVQLTFSKIVRELTAVRISSVLNGDLKLVLRPLSDLTKEIEHNGEKFVPLDILGFNERHIEVLNSEKIDVLNYWDFNRINKLFEWHFDIHNLIENGHAIDINEINKI